ERKPDKGGRTPMEPCGFVIKDRLAKFVADPATGKLKAYPILPSRIPVCTPDAIREYLRHPVGLRELRTDELTPAPNLSDHDRAKLGLATAEAERDAEVARLERLEREQRRSGQATQPAHRLDHPAALDAVARISPDKLNTISDCHKQLLHAGLTEDRWSA